MTPKESPMSPTTHSLFIVGRITKGERRLLFVRPPARPPIPGPWEVRAIFTR
jgi:hypothetical protein